MKIIFFIMFSFSFCVNAEEDAEVTNEDCVAAIRTAKDEVKDEAERLQRVASDLPITTSSNQGLSTGDPLTDMINNTTQTNQQLAKVEQDTSSQIASVEDSCFNQNQRMDDNLHQFRQSSYKRQQTAASASTEKLKAEAAVRIECANEAAANFAKELERLRGYQARSVGSIGGATQSEREIRRLEDRFYARCMARAATRETLLSIKENYDLQLRNLKTETESILSDMDNLERNRMRLGEHCSLRVERILEQNRIQQGSLRQNAQLNSMALQMAIMTSNANMANQGQAAARFTGVEQLLEPANWKMVTEACANQSSKPYDVPADIVHIFTEVNNKCSKAGGTNVRCIGSTGRNSSEQQRIQNGNRQINQ